MAVGSELPELDGYPFEVRYSDGSRVRALAAADVAAKAYVYFSRLFAGVEPDIAVIVADEANWSGDSPYGLPFFRDDAAEIRPGIVLMPAGGGDFWAGIAQDVRDASPADMRSCSRHTRTAQVAWTCSRFSTSSRSMSSATHSRCSEISGCRRSGSARSSSTWPCTRSSQPRYRRASRRSRCSQPWEREVESLPLGCAPRGTARSRSCKPITQALPIRWTR